MAVLAAPDLISHDTGLPTTAERVIEQVPSFPPVMTRTVPAPSAYSLVNNTTGHAI